MSDKYSGLEAALRSARMTFVSEANAGDRTGTEIIACEDLLPAWTKAGPKGDGSHEVGEACTHDGQSWRCCQAHNTNNNPDIEPGNSPAQWAPYHTTDPTKAKAFTQPTGAHDAYMKGECCLWTDGKVYRSIMETANAYSPAAYPQGWEEVTAAGDPGTTPEPGTEPEPETPTEPGTEQEPGQDPETGGEETGETVPAFVQPTGAHDAYQTGDRVTYNGQIYESTIDNNVWSPDTYPQGWEVVEVEDGGAA